MHAGRSALLLRGSTQRSLAARVKPSHFHIQETLSRGVASMMTVVTSFMPFTQLLHDISHLLYGIV